MTEKFEAIVIGGGPGGYVCAIRLAQLGIKTACIESRGTLGGTCLNIGCIPSKSLLNLSENFLKAKSFSKLGIEIGEVKLNLQKMMQNKDKAVTILTKGVEFLFKKNKVTYFKGIGKLKSNSEVSIIDKDNKETVVKSDKIIISTGSEPLSLPNLNFDEEKIISSTGALSLKKVPKKMIVIGGGYIGLEIASSLKHQNKNVTIIETENRILSRVASQKFSQFCYALHKKNNVNFKLSSNIENFRVEKNKIKNLYFSDKTMINTDLIIVGIGVNPDINALQNLNLNYDNGIVVNENFRSSEKNIWAIGDVARFKNYKYRLESIQNAQFSGKIAALDILNFDLEPREVPWFWSDQFNVKFQMVGVLYNPKNQEYLTIKRKGKKNESFSFWTFIDNKLVLVETANDSLSYMLGKKCLEKDYSPSWKDIQNENFELKLILNELN